MIDDFDPLPLVWFEIEDEDGTLDRILAPSEISAANVFWIRHGEGRRFVRFRRLPDPVPA